MSRTTLAAAVVVAMVAAGGAFFLTQRGQPVIVGPQPTTEGSATPSRPAVALPSVTPTATPLPVPTPILWTEARLDEDWPAPVRAEPAGGAIVVPIAEGEDVSTGYPDPLGDTGSDDVPWVDIRAVTVSTAPYVYIHLVSSPPSSVVPVDQWIAYGIVFDDDRDGVPDWRYGMDDRPATADESPDHTYARAWRTDLHTGRTDTDPPYYNGVDGILLDTYWDYDMRATFVFGGDVTGGGKAGMKVDVPFYVWASVIQDGRVVATDYAPDTGWLEPNGQVESSPSP